jgi:hypothetical protein
MRNVFVPWNPNWPKSPGWVVAENGCHIWTGAKRSFGYGVAYIPGGGRKNAKLVAVHRWRYEREVGPIPPGTELDHLCRTPACCNPAHMEPVTHRENVLRGSSPAARQATQSHCKGGHPLSGDNLDPHQLRRGKRMCVICRNARTRKYRIARIARGARR